jgi:hypothetical protein
VVVALIEGHELLELVRTVAMAGALFERVLILAGRGRDGRVRLGERS